MTMASLLYGITIRDQWDATQLAVNLNGTTEIFKVLVTDSYTPDANTHDQLADVTNEIANGSGYTTGGQALDNVSIAVAAGFVTIDYDDEAWTSMTKTGIRGAVDYDTTVAGDPLLKAVTYGADFSVTAGTFTEQVNASGAWRHDIIP